MKKRITTMLALCLTLMLASCGMSSEDITTSIDVMRGKYASGNYDEAYEYLETLDKAYSKMDDTQKNSYGSLRDSVQYAYENADAINASLAEIRSDLDQGLYYEANAALESLASAYTLPPTEKDTYNSYYSSADEGIRYTVVDNLLNAAMTAFNNNDYDTTVANLTIINEDIMTEDEIQIRDLWLRKAEELNKLNNAQTSYNNGSYTTAKSTLNTIDSSLLSADQQTQYQQLVTNTDAKIAEANRITAAKAIELVKQNQSAESKARFNYAYTYYDKGTYYLVCAAVTQNADGTDKYRVYKDGGRVVFIGSGSDWSGTDSEIN